MSKLSIVLILVLINCITSYAKNEVLSISLQQGIDGYSGCTDMMLDKENPAIADIGSEELIMQDTTKKKGCCLVNYKKNILIKFNIPLDKDSTEIISAYLKFFVQEYEDINANGPSTIYPIFTEWDLYTISWNNMPTYSSVISVPFIGVGVNEWQEIDVTDIINLYYKENKGNYGMMISFDNKGYEIVYASSDCSDESKRPVLEIKYKKDENSTSIKKAIRSGSKKILFDSKLNLIDLRHINGYAEVLIFNINGRQIFSTQKRDRNNTIELKNIKNAGLYVVQVKTHEDVFIEKINILN